MIGLSSGIPARDEFGAHEYLYRPALDFSQGAICRRRADIVNGRENIVLALAKPLGDPEGGLCRLSTWPAVVLNAGMPSGPSAGDGAQWRFR